MEVGVIEVIASVLVFYHTKAEESKVVQRKRRIALGQPMRGTEVVRDSTSHEHEVRHKSTSYEPFFLKSSSSLI